jgi:argininosuccinate lyase
VVDTLALVLPAMAGALRSTVFRPDRIERARDPELLATDLADILVRGGVPFREAHDHVGTLVRMAEERGVPLNELGDDTFGRVHPALGGGRARAAFDWEASVEARDVPGGTSRRRVEEQIADLREALGDAGSPRAGGEEAP